MKVNPSAISYKCNNFKGITSVYLIGKKVGEIRVVPGRDSFGYRYFPKGSNEGGDFFKSLAECKASLEAQ